MELKEVISKIEQLKEDDQKQIAKMIEEEMNWDNTLENSSSKLIQLAHEALNEHKAGRTQQKDW